MTFTSSSKINTTGANRKNKTQSRESTLYSLCFILYMYIYSIFSHALKMTGWTITEDKKIDPRVIIAQVVHPDVEAVYVQETRQIFAANQSFFQVTKQKLLTTMKSSGTLLSSSLKLNNHSRTAQRTSFPWGMDSRPPASCRRCWAHRCTGPQNWTPQQAQSLLLPKPCHAWLKHHMDPYRNKMHQQ